MADETVTRRTYLTVKALEAMGVGHAGGNIFAAIEAVASTAIEHPEWDMDERRTYEEWERS